MSDRYYFFRYDDTIAPEDFKYPGHLDTSEELFSWLAEHGFKKTAWRGEFSNDQGMLVYPEWGFENKSQSDPVEEQTDDRFWYQSCKTLLDVCLMWFNLYHKTGEDVLWVGYPTNSKQQNWFDKRVHQYYGAGVKPFKTSWSVFKDVASNIHVENLEPFSAPFMFYSPEVVEGLVIQGEGWWMTYKHVEARGFNDAGTWVYTEIPSLCEEDPVDNEYDLIESLAQPDGNINVCGVRFIDGVPEANYPDKLLRELNFNRYDCYLDDLQFKSYFR